MVYEILVKSLAKIEFFDYQEVIHMKLTKRNSRVF